MCQCRKGVVVQVSSSQWLPCHRDSYSTHLCCDWRWWCMASLWTNTGFLLLQLKPIKPYQFFINYKFMDSVAWFLSDTYLHAYISVLAEVWVNHCVCVLHFLLLLQASLQASIYSLPAVQCISLLTPAKGYSGLCVWHCTPQSVVLLYGIQIA